jgi:glycosyltransferase involved in cell wall biosynthesis
LTTKDGLRLLAMIPVRNEGERYLSVVLEKLSPLVSGIVILDDASTDHTPDLCRAHPKVLRYQRLPEPLFLRNEALFRSLLWRMTVELNPAWILALDADELLEAKAKKELPLLIHRAPADLIRFPIYHFWGNLEYYRVDGLWNPFLYPVACLYRYKRDRVYHWAERRLHCGRFPVEVYQERSCTAKLRMIHLGYAHRQAWQKKSHRYLQADPKGEFCPVEHYQSILAPHPELKRWTGERLEVFR